jgi:hypothetical protein
MHRPSVKIGIISSPNQFHGMMDARHCYRSSWTDSFLPWKLTRLAKLVGSTEILVLVEIEESFLFFELNQSINQSIQHVMDDDRRRVNFLVLEKS